MPIHLPWTPPINTLVEYSDNNKQSSDPEDVLLESLVSPTWQAPSWCRYHLNTDESFHSLHYRYCRHFHHHCWYWSQGWQWGVCATACGEE